MDERALRVDKEHIRNPNLFHQTCVEGATLVAAGGEGQAVVLPVVPQVQSHGEVLEKIQKETQQRPQTRQLYNVGGLSAGNAEARTMFTSDMLSMLSTWTSMPTGIAEPAKDQRLCWIGFEEQ